MLWRVIVMMATTSLVEPTATDFWGAAVPAWISAAGGLVGGLVAVVSLLIAVASAKRANDANARADKAKASAQVSHDVLADTIRFIKEEPVLDPEVRYDATLDPDVKYDATIPADAEAEAAYRARERGRQFAESMRDVKLDALLRALDRQSKEPT